MSDRGNMDLTDLLRTFLRGPSEDNNDHPLLSLLTQSTRKKFRVPTKEEIVHFFDYETLAVGDIVELRAPELATQAWPEPGLQAVVTFVAPQLSMFKTGSTPIPWSVLIVFMENLDEEIEKERAELDNSTPRKPHFHEIPFDGRRLRRIGTMLQTSGEA